MPALAFPARLREPSTWASIAALAGTAATMAATAPGGETIARIAQDTAEVAQQTRQVTAAGAPWWLVVLTLVSGGLGVFLRERSGQTAAVPASPAAAAPPVAPRIPLPDSHS